MFSIVLLSNAPVGTSELWLSSSKTASSEVQVLKFIDFPSPNSIFRTSFLTFSKSLNQVMDLGSFFGV